MKNTPPSRYHMRSGLYLMSALFVTAGFLTWAPARWANDKISGAVFILAGIVCLAAAAVVETITREAEKIRDEIRNCTGVSEAAQPAPAPERHTDELKAIEPSDVL